MTEALDAAKNPDGGRVNGVDPHRLQGAQQ